MSHTHTAIQCKNCKNEFHGHYCPNCGQKAKTKRLHFNDIFSELLNAFTYLNRGILFTIKELTLRPGHSIREYVEGKRVVHFHPVNYLLMIGGLSTWIYITFWDNFFDIKSLVGPMTAQDRKMVLPFVEKILHFAFENYTYQLMISIIMYGFFSSRILGNSRYNFTEGVVLNLFLLSHAELIKLLLFPFQIFGKAHLILLIVHGIVASLLTSAYIIWAYIQFFEEKNIWRGIGKAFLVILATAVCIGLISGIGGFLFGLYSKHHIHLPFLSNLVP